MDTRFLLPKPLLLPSQWPGLAAAAVWLLPLDVALVAGGPLRERFVEIIRAQRAAWYLPARFFGGSGQESVQTSIRKSEALAWIEDSPGAGLYSDQPKRLRSVFGSKLASLGLQVPDATEWAHEIFPQLTASSGELWLRKALTQFGKQMGSELSFPWEDLRFFAGFVRRRGDTERAMLAAREWAHFSALYSPQDEVAEAKALGAGRLTVNPTLQTLRSNDVLLLIYRTGREARETTIGWREALLVDELSEEARQIDEELLEKVEREAAGAEKTLDRVGGTGTFRDALQGLINQGILLRGE